MKTEDILSHVDHTLLKAAASWEEIRKLCDEAMEYRTASVCVPSCYVKKIRENYPRLTICTVVGFPLGNGNSESKAAETIHAIDDGADEIDMVINIGAVKNKNYDLVTEEIAVLKEIAGDKILKVIVETCYLTEEEKIRLCECVTKGRADYIKTSTGVRYGRRFFGGYRTFQKTHREKCKNQSGGRYPYKGRYGSFPHGGCGPHRRQRSDQGALRRITLLFPDEKRQQALPWDCCLFCVLRPHIFSVKKVMGLSLFRGEKEAVSFCDVPVF